MWNRRRTWIILMLVAAASVLIATRYFERAFPLVAVDLEMDRSGALETAQGLAAERGWPTAGYRQAASFGQGDAELKRYIELEAGGPGAWSGLVESGEHAAYRWTVRQFREGEVTESELTFGADGTPWGYELTLPEDAPGASLDVATARGIAEATAASWGVDLSMYDAVETGEEVRPAGRVDHWFVYERPDMEYGDARFRLRLAVSGDVPSAVTRYAEVPEAFERRYAEMRSANNLIAMMASLSAVLLYLLIGAGVGMVMLMRKGGVEWRRPLLWGGVIGGLMTAAALNELPMAWMGYDTAVPASGFLTEQVLMAVVGGLTTALYVALMIMAGENLARRAFPDHVQLWKSWSRGVANSRSLLGMTIGGYAFAGLFMASAVLFYMLANNVLGWPVSADSLLHPDMLATPFPWLSALAISLMAGFSEEAMFRAIPLAGAALIGARFGRKGLWIAAALVIQAVIFAGAHANYPQQPAYARVVELMLPSIALGLVFLRFGFMPAVIAHFTYDLIWFSIPVFASSAPGTWMNQGVLVALGLVPLGIVLVARYRWGAVDAVPVEARNGGWRPTVAGVDAGTEAVAGTASPEPEMAPARSGADRPDRPAGAGSVLSPRLVRLAPVFGLAGLVLWGATATFRPLSPALEVGADQAVESARAALIGADLLESAEGSEWRLLPSVHAARTDEHRFVWEAAGREAFEALLGTHLKAPHWDVRAARFDGELDVRAEELMVEVDRRGDVARIRHTLPEERPGAAMEETLAQGLALSRAEELWEVGSGELRPVSAEANQRPARRDWTFTFASPVPVDLSDGEARVRLTIAGDRVTDADRFIHVPEQWERDQRAKETREFIIGGLTGLLVIIFGVVGLVLAVRGLGRSVLSTRVAVVTGMGIMALMGVTSANGWRSTVAGFSTAQPYGNQVTTALAGMFILALVLGIVAGLFTALAHRWADDADGTRRGDWRAAFRVGLPAGALLVGVMTAVDAALSSGPPWSSYSGADAVIPALAAAMSPITDLVVTTVFILLALGALRRVPARNGRGIPVRALLATAVALVVASGVAYGELAAWLVGTVVMLAILYAGLELVRYAGSAVIPAVAAVVVLMELVPAIAQGPFPGARPGMVLGAALMLTLAVAWSRWLPGPAERTTAVRADARPEAAPRAVPAGGEDVERSAPGGAPL